VVIFFLFCFSSFLKKTHLITIVGTYECKVDAKGSAVSAFKSNLPSLQNGFVLKRSVFQPV
jgi:MraZ protein